MNACRSVSLAAKCSRKKNAEQLAEQMTIPVVHAELAAVVSRRGNAEQPHANAIL